MEVHMINEVYLTDEQLDLWGNVYVHCHFENKFRFDEFILNPWAYLRIEHQESAPQCILDGYLPLLPEQAKLIADYWHEVDQQKKTENILLECESPKILPYHSKAHA